VSGLMMKIFLQQSLFILMLFAADVYASQSTGELPVYSRIYDEQRDPNDDGRAALKLAKETQRKVLIEVGGDWCAWCHVLDKFIKDHSAIEKTFARNICRTQGEH